MMQKRKTEKKEVLELIKLWANHNSDEIADKLDRPKSWVVRIVSTLRTSGGKNLVPKKLKMAYLIPLIEEIIRENTSSN